MTTPIDVQRGRRRHAAWRTVGRGLHRSPSPESPAGATTEELAAARRDALLADLWAWSPILRPTACFTHLTSAAARGWWLPPLPEVPVWIAQITGQNPTTRRGARVVRTRAIPASDRIAGLPIAVPAETLVTCAQDLGLLDVVVMLDCALHREEVTPAEVARVAAEQRRGAPLLRQAIELADRRSESPWESLLRLLHVVCGVDVEPQRRFFDHGRFVARADLWVVGTCLLQEHDGGGHRAVAQHRSDLERDRRIADAGLTRRGYTAPDLCRHPQDILAPAYAALGRPFHMGMLDPWWPLWETSCFSLQGRRRLSTRLARRQTRTPSRTTADLVDRHAGVSPDQVSCCSEARPARAQAAGSTPVSS
jgi:hypothetical protein